MPIATAHCLPKGNAPSRHLSAEDKMLTRLAVRPEEGYLAGHIPGARHAQLGSLAGRTAELRDASDVVAYWRGSFCVMAHDAVRLLGAEGIATRRLEDGTLEWRTHDHPVEVGAP